MNFKVMCKKQHEENLFLKGNQYLLKISNNEFNNNGTFHIHVETEEKWDMELDYDDLNQYFISKYF